VPTPVNRVLHTLVTLIEAEARTAPDLSSRSA
jgi:2-dehydropantoate 2-reductase